MKGAILEVVLVSAEGIGGTSILGNAAYHVILECGAQISRSKISSENMNKIYWNEKFIFELPPSELETLSHLKLTILSKEYPQDDEFVGETMIFLKGMVVEGGYRGTIELTPAPFNVVLEDDTYKGQLTIALKFIPDIILHTKRKQYAKDTTEVGKTICNTTLSFIQMKWWEAALFLWEMTRKKHN